MKLTQMTSSSSSKMIGALITLSLSQLLILKIISTESLTGAQTTFLIAVIAGLFTIGLFFSLPAIFSSTNQPLAPRTQLVYVFAYSLMLFNLIFISLNLFIATQWINSLSLRHLTRPKQTFTPNSPSAPTQPVTTYVYWVHLKGEFENNCCFGENPTPPTPDPYHIFTLKQEAPDPKGYEGVVCSPDCQTKVIWSGPVNFSGFAPPSRLTWQLMLTPTGPIEPIPPNAKIGTTIPLEIVTKAANCKDDSCIVNKQVATTNLESPEVVSLIVKDRILPITTYDIYVCRYSCQSNQPLPPANPLKCTSNELGIISLKIVGDFSSC